MSAFLKKKSTALAEYVRPRFRWACSYVRWLIKKVTIYENKFTVEFKFGLTVDANE